MQNKIMLEVVQKEIEVVQNGIEVVQNGKEVVQNEIEVVQWAAILTHFYKNNLFVLW